MKKNHLAKKALQICLLTLIIVSENGFAQVGIGTTTPSTSAALDITSTTQGMLTPRMTTTQRTAIASPADGLIVYDTTLQSFYYYNTTGAAWTRVNSDVTGRSKFKRIKSTDVLATVLADELAAGSGSKYVLETGTYYEINGAIVFNFPIDINNAYVGGIDSNEDKLIRTSGNLFDGSTGGSIRNVTIQVTGGGKVFNLSGATTQNLLFRDSVVAGCSNVGSITGFGWVFTSVVQYTGNTNGIIYDSITRLLINNTGWFSNNSGIYEKFQGTFGLIQKLGGFMEVAGASVGFDVSANPVITSDAVLEAVVFTGALSTGFYVKPYTVGSYTGYNFNNRWNVRSPGIPTETDLVAAGDINFDYTISGGFQTALTTGGNTKLLGVSTSNELFRFSRGGENNRLVYLGSKKRFFRVGGSISFQTTADNTTFVFYIAKNGVIINKSKVFIRSNSTVDVLAVPIPTIVELTTNDYVEVYAGRVNGSGNVSTVSLNLSIN